MKMRTTTSTFKPLHKKHPPRRPLAQAKERFLHTTLMSSEGLALQPMHEDEQPAGTGPAH